MVQSRVCKRLWMWHSAEESEHCSTWRNGASLLCARDGILRGNYRVWRDDFSPHFRPSQHEASLSRQWLRDNQALFSPVAQAA